MTAMYHTEANKIDRGQMKKCVPVSPVPEAWCLTERSAWRGTKGLCQGDMRAECEHDVRPGCLLGSAMTSWEGSRPVPQRRVQNKVRPTHPTQKLRLQHGVVSGSWLTRET